MELATSSYQRLWSLVPTLISEPLALAMISNPDENIVDLLLRLQSLASNQRHVNRHRRGRQRGGEDLK